MEHDWAEEISGRKHDRWRLTPAWGLTAVVIILIIAIIDKVSGYPGVF